MGQMKIKGLLLKAEEKKREREQACRDTRIYVAGELFADFDFLGDDIREDTIKVEIYGATLSVKQAREVARRILEITEESND
jgi:hypothetical protein